MVRLQKMKGYDIYNKITIQNERLFHNRLKVLEKNSELSESQRPEISNNNDTQQSPFGVQCVNIVTCNKCDLTT